METVFFQSFRVNISEKSQLLKIYMKKSQNDTMPYTTDCSHHTFGNDLDPNKNVYNNISKCNYYTDLQLNEEIGVVNGLSFIHSLKTNVHTIKDYILELC